MNGLIAWWARNTVAANLLMIAIFVAGFIGYSKMERELSPTVQFPGMSINVAWPGAAPQEVEEQIVARIEEALSDLDNIQWIRSTSGENFGNVIVLASFNIDFTLFMNDVKTRIDSINSFPRDMEPPRITQFVNRNEMIRVAVHGDFGEGVQAERKLTDLAEKLRREAASLPNVSLIQLFGARQAEVAVEVSEDALRRYNLSFNDVASAIRGTSINQSAGTVRTETGALSIRARNMADTEAEFGNIIVRQTSDGGTIRVKDIGTVTDGFEDNPILATINGEPAILLQIMSTETMNITKASESITKWMEERKATLPEGANLTLWNDNADIFNSRMTTISTAAIQGLLLVMLVLVLTLRPKVAFWVSMGIATAYAGAFVLLPYLDVSLNLLSTFAFLLVLGIVVDDAIVVGESIHSEASQTGGGVSAAILGTQMVAKPVIFAVLTTIIVFLPWIFLSGGTSEFTRQITWVVIVALSFSLIESLLILPAHLANMKPRTNLGRFGKFQKRIADSIVNFAHTKYRKIGEVAVARRYLTASIFTFILVVSISLMSLGYVKMRFDPEIEGDQISIDVALPEGTTFDRAQEVLAQLQSAEQALIDEVDLEFSGERELIENWYTRSRRDSVLALIKLAPAEKRGNVPAKDIALRLRELIGDIPDAKGVSVNWGLDNDNSAGLEFSISHPDLDMLKLAVDDVKEKLRSYDTLYDVRDDMQSASEEIRVSLKPGAEKLGIKLQDVSRQLRQAYYGVEVQRLARSNQDVKVMVRYPRESRRSVESLEHFRIRTADGREIPLMSVAELDYAPGIKQIKRRDRRRAASVSADLKTDTRDDIIKDLDENYFPEWEKRFPGVKQGAIGQAEGQARFLAELFPLVIMAFGGMYMLLAIAFKSYAQPIAIMISIPFAFAGAILGHGFMGVSMSIFSFFGIAAAAGVVINDNLVLVDYCNRLRARGHGVKEAIVEAGVARFRPILLTSVTTFVGLMPMMMEKSIQAAFLIPIVIALAFGVLIAFFVTLLLVPSMYAIGDDITHLKRRIWNWVRTRVFGKEPKVEIANEGSVAE